MKKNIFTLLIALFLISLPLASSAQLTNFTNETAQTAGYNLDAAPDGTGVAYIMGIIARSFIALIGVMFISYIIYGGFMWMTARGDEDKISKARHAITDGIIGLVIVLSAAGIYWFIISAFVNVNNTSSGGIPTTS